MRQSDGGIDWYCELRGSGPTVVLIPSGEGDCQNFDTVAGLLEDQFTVLTFDTPGFSRTSAPPDFERFSERSLSDQIASLVTSLDLGPATFYGCSSGGHAVLSLVADHPEVVRNGIVHEVALVAEYAWPDVMVARSAALNELDDDTVARACADRFRNQMNHDPQAWDALGEEYHQRLERNYVTWVRHYLKPGAVDRTYDKAELTRRPIAWSVGGFSQVWAQISNLRTAQRGGIDVEIFQCCHFPQVSIPETLAEHIRENALPHAS